MVAETGFEWQDDGEFALVQVVWCQSPPLFSWFAFWLCIPVRFGGKLLKLPLPATTGA